MRNFYFHIKLDIVKIVEQNKMLKQFNIIRK